ncbi:enoyl-CoA hydratase-related protein [Nitrospirillum viridazoti]|uniref:Enoyl-CoA hydratase n=1 Tax=Nitrospirillum viridazoti CBAmc TaxID=1441467 RepID=A0A248JR59_9PROT|nr:enoyl-CoA hydratase-related protein [Nitrospirillum amazonense]ASG21089.1 enoyl-CoA hydratase [Nitrospirillum amazonense CBAmc]TWB32404.1 enoyl-CoA hydratase/carnithine racemase [Nitrospirillum amazonense]
MSQAAVLVEDGNGVRTLVLNRPEKRNALTGAMYSALAEALTGAATDDAVGAVLIQGSGGSFTAGNDLADFLASPTLSADTPVMRFLHALATFPKPVVAAVEGHAVGVGTTLLMHCDLVYAAPTAHFAMPFVSLGLVPEAGSSVLAARLLGHPRAAAMLMAGEALTADAAEAAGLINAVIPSETLYEHAAAKAAALAAKPRAAMANTKALMRHDTPQVLEAMAREATLFAQALTSPEAKAAFQAFLSKGR